MTNELITENWVKELLEKFPDCPDPMNYPRSAFFYLQEELGVKNRDKEE